MIVMSVHNLVNLCTVLVDRYRYVFVGGVGVAVVRVLLRACESRAWRCFAVSTV